MTLKKQLVDVVQMVHGWATVGVGRNGSILLHKHLIDALKRRAEINDNMMEPYDYWLIDGLTVREPSLDGKVIGTVAEIEIKDKSILRMSANSLEYLIESSRKSGS